MMIGGDDISNDVINLCTCFFNVCFSSQFRSMLIGRNLTAQSTGSHKGIGGGTQILETSLQALPPFFLFCGEGSRVRCLLKMDGFLVYLTHGSALP